MLAKYSRSLFPLWCVAAFAACDRDAGGEPPLAPAALTTSSSGFITGRVLGPAGSVCNSLPAGTRMVVRPINLATHSFAGFLARFCPDDTYSFFVPEGTNLLRVELPSNDAVLAGFPW